MTNLLQTLAAAPRECIYALINEADKKVQIHCTTNFLTHISKLTQELSHLNNQALKADLDKIQLVILETNFNSAADRYAQYKRIAGEYRTKGYEFYNELSVVQYKLRESYKYKGGKPYYFIELVGGKGSKPVLVGVFAKWREARGFQDMYYKDGIITKVVVADNELTRGWYV